MIVLLILFIQAEARVFCQDSHAQPWDPQGYSCPINCDNVITAVRKLKVLEYNKLFANEDNQIHKTEKMSDERAIVVSNNDKFYNGSNGNTMTINEYRRSNTLENANIRIYKRYYKILNNERVAKDLKTEFKAVMSTLKKCYSQNEVKYTFLKKFNKICTRRSNIELDFLKKFTAILNKYTNSIPFTEDLTAMILEKILGKNLDLRHGIFDVKKIILFLSSAIRNHELTKGNDIGQVINLRPRQCLSLSMSGCFCMEGFVEKTGQCVLPADCFQEPVEQDLLSRIIVH